MKEKSLFRQFSEYVSFNVLAMISISLYILADTFFVSTGIGLNGLTSLNLALPIFSFVSAVSMMIGMGGATLFSLVKSGRGDEQAKNVFTVVALFGLVFSLVLVAIGAFFNQPLAVALGAKAHIIADTAVYIKYSLIFAPAFILSRIFISFVRNNGSPMLSMMAMVVGSLSNIVLDYIFIFPCNMGMLGAVIATCLAPIISIIVVLPYLLKDKGALKLVVPTKVLRLCPPVSE